MSFADRINFFCTSFQSAGEGFFWTRNREDQSDRPSADRLGRRADAIGGFLAQPELGAVDRKAYDHTAARIIMVIHLDRIESRFVEVYGADRNGNPGNEGVCSFHG